MRFSVFLLIVVTCVGVYIWTHAPQKISSCPAGLPCLSQGRG